MRPTGPKVPTLTILSHPDGCRVSERTTLWSADADHGEALLSRWELGFRAPGGGEARPLDDPYLSRRPIQVTAARFGDIRLDHPGPCRPPWFPVRLAAALAAYEWPRNVSQLRRVVRQLVAEHHERDQIEVGPDLVELLEIASESSGDWGSRGVAGRAAGAATREPSDISEIEPLSALRAHRWQAEPTASHLGIAIETLFQMIEKFSENSQCRSSRRRGPLRPEAEPDGCP